MTAASDSCHLCALGMQGSAAAGAAARPAALPLPRPARPVPKERNTMEVIIAGFGCATNLHICTGSDPSPMCPPYRRVCAYVHGMCCEELGQRHSQQRPTLRMSRTSEMLKRAQESSRWEWPGHGSVADGQNAKQHSPTESLLTVADSPDPVLVICQTMCIRVDCIVSTFEGKNRTVSVYSWMRNELSQAPI